MINSKNRPSGLKYNVKDSLSKKFIYAYGLCGKALSSPVIKEQVQKKTKNPNRLILNCYQNQLDKFYSYFLNLDIYDDKIITDYSVKATIRKYPLHFCTKCNDARKYRIYRNYIYCSKCESNRTNKWMSVKRKEDDVYRFIASTRGLILSSLKKQGFSKDSKTADVLGCDFDTFKTHIERKFTKGMSWSNYGKWHLDHIYPISKATSFEMALKLNHYTNFQPLWAKDNISKNNKLVEHQMILPI